MGTASSKKAEPKALSERSRHARDTWRTLNSTSRVLSMKHAKMCSASSGGRSRMQKGDVAICVALQARTVSDVIAVIFVPAR